MGFFESPARFGERKLLYHMLLHEVNIFFTVFFGFYQPYYFFNKR